MDVLPIREDTWKVRERWSWGDKAPNALPPCRAVSQASKAAAPALSRFQGLGAAGRLVLVKVKSGETLPHAAENKRSRSHNQGHRAAGNEGCQRPVLPRGKMPFCTFFFTERSGGTGGTEATPSSPEVGRGARLWAQPRGRGHVFH